MCSIILEFSSPLFFANSHAAWNIREYFPLFVVPICSSSISSLGKYLRFRSNLLNGVNEYVIILDGVPVDVNLNFGSVFLGEC
jgi:hypothetical protein